jgi:hypothetical protein
MHVSQDLGHKKQMSRSYPDRHGRSKKLKAEARARQAKNWKPRGTLHGYVATTQKIWTKPRSYPFAGATELVFILSSQHRDQAALASRGHGQAASMGFSSHDQALPRRRRYGLLKVVWLLQGSGLLKEAAERAPPKWQRRGLLQTTTVRILCLVLLSHTLFNPSFSSLSLSILVF